MELDLVVVQGDVVQILQDKGLDAVDPGEDAGKEKAQGFAVGDQGRGGGPAQVKLQVDDLEAGETEIFQGPF